MSAAWIALVILAVLSCALLWLSRRLHRHRNLLSDRPERSWPTADLEWAATEGFENYLERLRNESRLCWIGGWISAALTLVSAVYIAWRLLK